MNTSNLSGTYLYMTIISMILSITPFFIFAKGFESGYLRLFVIYAFVSYISNILSVWSWIFFSRLFDKIILRTKSNYNYTSCMGLVFAAILNSFIIKPSVQVLMVKILAIAEDIPI